MGITRGRKNSGGELNRKRYAERMGNTPVTRSVMSSERYGTKLFSPGKKPIAQKEMIDDPMKGKKACYEVTRRKMGSKGYILGIRGEDAAEYLKVS